MVDKKKEITFIIASLEGFGGTNRVATLLANSLSLHYDITILSRYSIQNTYFLESKVKDVKFTGNTISFLYQCKKYISSEQPHIVIIHTMSKLTPALLLGGIKAKNIWSIEHVSFEFHSVFFKLLRCYLYKKINRVITLTEADALNYKSFHPAVTIIANLTPLPLRMDTGVSKTSKNIVSIGRLTYQKGYDLLIDAWSLVESKYPNWSLHIYGEGEDRDKLEKMITDKSLENVALKGLTSKIQAVYDNAAFYVMSSRFEGLPVVLIEAQSRGLPIVSFDCPSGPAEIIENGVNGYLVQNADIKALANRISYLIDNKQIRQDFSNTALMSAKRFDPEVIIKQWVDLINRECK